MTTRANHQSTKHSSPNPILERHIATAEEQISARQPHILIVEDHAETSFLMQYALRTHYHTEVVATADEALRQAAATTYDGFLIDICLRSQQNGIDVLEALRARKQYRHAPMVAVTAHALPGDRKRFLDAGFDDYVSKPFAASDLRATLHRQMQLQDSHPALALENVPAE